MTAASATQRIKDLTERLAALRVERERLLGAQISYEPRPGRQVRVTVTEVS